eukprot:CAMPEP_0169076666 /NCGR_PEP_ID=MMETSP1015-20121227/8471_1 /TAXON_ID=342587 /ORGANISM="Karlodinium micrum, Strain CCMP2283" /LENGTH=36 /DNA_ID= /DNA_START= /DNA_END= /DNA_ORIENTATION=
MTSSASPVLAVLSPSALLPHACIMAGVADDDPSAED